MTEEVEPTCELTLKFYEGDPAIAQLQEEIHQFSDDADWGREPIEQYGMRENLAWAVTLVMNLTTEKSKAFFVRLAEMISGPAKIDIPGGVSVVARNAKEVNDMSPAILLMMEAANERKRIESGMGDDRQYWLEITTPVGERKTFHVHTGNIADAAIKAQGDLRTYKLSNTGILFEIKKNGDRADVSHVTAETTVSSVAETNAHGN